MESSVYISPIIPVLDLMIGQIVLAQGGNRDQYLPVDTRLTRSAQPLDVARAMFNQTGCDWVYLADIDSFSGAAPAWRVYRELLDAGFGLWVDADWLSEGRVEQIVDQLPKRDRLRVIVSSETMGDLPQFNVFESLVRLGVRPIFSLDLKASQVISGSSELMAQTPLDLVARAYDAGVRDVIVLDLALVGTMQDSIDEMQTKAFGLIKQVVKRFPDVCVTSGGGVATAEDAQAWLTAGCDHVLAASAIHQCRLTPDDVAQLLPRAARERLRRTAK